MKVDNKDGQETQRDTDLSLFDWRFAVVHPRTAAGSFVVRRYHVDPAIADAIAEAAGLGEVRA